MRYVPFLLLFILLYNPTTAQETAQSIYFPQEQIILSICDSTKEKNSCVNDFFLSKIKGILEQDIHLPSIKNDTINVSVSFDITDNNKIGDTYKYVYINDSTLRKSSGDKLTAILEQIPEFTVINKKPDQFLTKHIFRYSLVLAENAQLKSICLQKECNYSGGIIEEPTVFPGCEDRLGQDRIRCFNTNMQAHLRTNFRYPRKAQKKKIEGKVYIMFKINQEGKVSEIRTRGPHPLLEEEAKRIIRLLPICKPGLRNGETISTPFSIPLTFKLQ